MTILGERFPVNYLTTLLILTTKLHVIRNELGI